MGTITPLRRRMIEQFWFRGSFAMDDVVFFHRPSLSAILTGRSPGLFH